MDGLIGFPPVDVDQLQLAVLGAQQNEVWLEDRGGEGADHGIVLDDALEEERFYYSACASHHLPHIKTVIQTARHQFVA